MLMRAPIDMAGPEEEDLMACEGVVGGITVDRGTSMEILYHRQTHSALCHPLDEGGTCPSPQ